MHVAVADGFQEGLWPRVNGRLYASPPWLRANVARPGARPFTIQASDTDGAAAVLAYLYNDAEAAEAYNLRRMIQGEPLVFPWTASGADRLRALTPRLQLFPSVCAVLPGYDAGLVRTASAGRRHVRTALASLTEAARARAAGTSAVLYVDRNDTTLVDALADAGYAAIALTSRAVLPVGWDDLDGYLAHLPARRRHRVSTELNRLARLRVRSTFADPASEVATVVRLRCAHLRSFGREPDEDGERRRLATMLTEFAGEDLRLVLTVRDGRPVSCALFLRAGTRLTTLLGATDPAAGVRLTHFESSFYAPVRLGLPRRGDVIDYGISHLEHKTLRGCVPQPLDAWVRADDPTTMVALRRIGQLSRTGSLEAPGQPRPAAAGTARPAPAVLLTAAVPAMRPAPPAPPASPMPPVPAIPAVPAMPLVPVPPAVPATVPAAPLAPAVPAVPARQLDIIVAAGIDFITGVPDSGLAGLLAELPDSAVHDGPAAREAALIYVRATREDNAVALAAGASLAGRTPLVFMKSMGVGTAVDALTSLAQVYELPLVIYVSWAGFQGRDVPHHNALGSVLPSVLRSLRVAHVRHVIGRLDELALAAGRAVDLARARHRPVALLGIPPSLLEDGRDAA